MKIYLCAAILGTLCYFLVTIAVPQLAALPSPASKPAKRSPAQNPAEAASPGPQSSSKPPAPSSAELIQQLMHNEARAQQSVDEATDTTADPQHPTKRRSRSKLDADYDLRKHK